MRKEKDDVITDAGIDDIVSRIQDIRSKCPQSVAYKAIKALEPFLEPCRTRLIDEYLLVVAEIEKDKKRLLRPERQDYLKRLLTPLIKLNRLQPSGENPYLKHDGTYPFIEEKIWIDKEIDIESLHYDKQRYSINFEYSKPLSYFDPDARNITIWDEYREYINKKKKKDAEAKARGIKFRPITPIDAGKTSLRELYKKWRPTLTQDKIKSKDLLDQILVCFTNKRALNGDEKAINKLYSIYENGAIGTAVNMAKRRKLNKDDIDDVKQKAKECLRFLIPGFRPEDIINSLSDRNGIPLKIPLWTEKFYLWYLSDHVPKEIDRIMKQPPKRLDGIEFDYLLNPISIIDAYTFWQGTPKRVMKFNSYSFRPRKEYYLTTWLFGTKKNFMKGKFCQMINEILDGYFKKRTEITHKLIDEMPNEYSERENDEMNEHEKLSAEMTRKLLDKKKFESPKPIILKTGYFCKECKQYILTPIEPKKGRNIFQRCADHDEFKAGKRTGKAKTINIDTANMAIEKLVAAGIPKRNAEIFVKNRLLKYKKTELGKEYSLERRQVYRIVKSISSKYPTL